MPWFRSRLVLAAYMVALSVALLTQVPGGLGVLELILLTLLKDSVGESVLASVLIFRLLVLRHSAVIWHVDPGCS